MVMVLDSLLFEKFVVCIEKEVVVEDDTCLARIISSIEYLVDDSFYLDFFVQLINEGSKDIFGLCAKILNDAERRQHSISAFFVKLFSALSHRNLIKLCTEESLLSWQKCLKVVLLTKISHEVYCASYQSAWLHSVAQLLDNRSVVSFVVEIAETLNQELFFLLANSTSLFVTKHACQTLSKLILELHSAQLIENKINDEIVEKKNKMKASLLQAVMSSVSFACKILTECFRLNSTLASDIVEAHFKDFFADSTHQNILLRLCEEGDATLHNFIIALPPQTRCLPVKLLHELVILSLRHHPLRASTYTMLSHVLDITRESLNNFFPILTLPFRLLIDDTFEVNDCNILKPWNETILKTWKSASKTSSLLSHCCSALTQLSTDGFFDSGTESDIFKLLLEALSCINELKGAHSAARFRDGKCSLFILDCLLTSTKRQQCCLPCKYNGIIGIFLDIFSHPDSNHRVMERVGQILLAIVEVTCEQHWNNIFLFIEHIHKKMEHLRWADRDTAIELLRSVLESIGANQELKKANLIKRIKNIGIDSALLDRVADTSSFIRSSALRALAVWVKFDDSEKTEDLVLLGKTALTVINSDTEAVARRSAVKLVSAIATSRTSFRNEIMKNFLVSRSELLLSAHLKESGNSDQMVDIVSLFNEMLKNNLSKDLDWEVQINIIDLLKDIFQSAKSTFVEQQSRFESITEKIASLVQPLIDSLDVAVSERAVDLLSHIDDTYDVTISEKRKVAMVIGELNGLLRDVLYQINKDTTEENVILDCY